jgi:hypothetical protein
VLDRWQTSGDASNIQKFTSGFGTSAYTGASILGNSNAVYSDASFLRCKNLSLSYSIPQNLAKPFHLENVRVYLQSQNLFTVTNYAGADPENQNMFILPPLRTITTGIQFNFN